MFVGYATNHDGDCYRMWRPNPHYIYETRDVTWLKRMYFDNNQQRDANPVQIVDVPNSAAGESTERGTAAPAPSPEETAPPPPEPPSKLKVTIGGVEMRESDSESSVEEEDEMRGSSVEEEDEMRGIDKTFLPVGAKRSRTGRTIHPRAFYHHEYQGICADNSNYYEILGMDSDEESDDENEEVTSETACVGAGIGGGFKHSTELKPLNYKQAMQSKEKSEWVKEIKKENDRMKKYNVWTPVAKESVPDDVIPLTST
jgi:hypothetical protein